MHGQVRARLRARGRDERGAIAIVMAFSLVVVIIISAMVLDFGLVRVDRQTDKSAADSATLAGLHALNRGDGSPHPYVGVCNAVRYLKTNDDRFSGINEGLGWKNGLGAATGNGCTDVTLRNRTCSVTDKSSWAVWHWTGTSDGISLDVTIQSGYSFAGSYAQGWPEDSLPASSPDTTEQGCDQLAVTIKQSRKPGLGSLATSSDLRTNVRTVGRVQSQPGNAAPALLLLKRTGCPVLHTGNSGGGSGTFIHVLGALGSSIDANGVVTPNSRSAPGTIHADSDGTGCPNNTNVYMGEQNDGIVAYAAPLIGNPTSPDPAQPGSITSVAAANGVSQSVVRDSLNWVYGASGLNTAAAGAKNEVVGRPLITRKLVDQRYFTGVKAAISGSATVFAAGKNGPISGWKKFPGGSFDACKPTQADVNALNLTATDSLYIDCTKNPKTFVGSGPLTINAGTVYFRNSVSPAAVLSLPNASHVYIGNESADTNALSVGGSGTFQMNNKATNLSGTTCSNGQNSSKATLFVQSGVIQESTGGLVQMCRTTVFMLGGRSDGCVPATAGTAPTSTPCNGTLGSGQFTMNGGGIDWTAPDTMDVTLDATNKPLSGAVTAWADPNGPEDLALWSESASNTNTLYKMTGGGLFHVRGVYMVPNAQPFTISGGAGLNLTNAQYIASSIELNGGAQITMSVDPNSAVTLPELGLVGLIR
jgi:Putative Flp pilus-assembly TadE/G-like